MDVFYDAVKDFLDAWIPSGSAYATEWYTLNDLIAYLFSICVAIIIFGLIFYVMFWLPVGLTIRKVRGK